MNKLTHYANRAHYSSFRFLKSDQSKFIFPSVLLNLVSTFTSSNKIPAANRFSNVNGDGECIIPNSFNKTTKTTNPINPQASIPNIKSILSYIADFIYFFYCKASTISAQVIPAIDAATMLIAILTSNARFNSEATAIKITTPMKKLLAFLDKGMIRDLGYNIYKDYGESK